MIKNVCEFGDIIMTLEYSVIFNLFLFSNLHENWISQILKRLQYSLNLDKSMYLKIIIIIDNKI